MCHVRALLYWFTQCRALINFRCNSSYIEGRQCDTIIYQADLILCYIYFSLSKREDGEGLNKYLVGPNIAFTMRSAEARSRLLSRDLKWLRNICLARSIAALSHRGAAKKLCTSSSIAFNPPLPEQNSHWSMQSTWNIQYISGLWEQSRVFGCSFSFSKQGRHQKVYHLWAFKPCLVSLMYLIIDRSTYTFLCRHIQNILQQINSRVIWLAKLGVCLSNCDKAPILLAFRVKLHSYTISLGDTFHPSNDTE